MKPSHHANPIQSAPTHYAPSVPMSVHRELAAELRANKAVIDSLNSRNQQLLDQNQRLKQEIHNVVQATLSLGQFAGVARQTAHDEFPSAIAPDTLAKLVRAQGEARKVVPSDSLSAQDMQPAPYAQPAPADYREQRAPYPQALQQGTAEIRPPAAAQKRVPRPIQPTSATVKSSERTPTSKRRPAQSTTQSAARKGASARKSGPRDIASAVGNPPLPKLFTEQVGGHRSTALESTEDKEISGIWLALSIILIVVTAFGAGFLIMKPLLNDR